jgi:IS30 family transposase
MRKYRRLTRGDRITIERRLEQGKKQIEIAEELGVHRSSICREVARNGAQEGPYRWRGAQAKAICSRRHPIFGYSRKIEGALEELITEWLLDKLSPDQISNRLQLEKAPWSVSHETIYKWIYKVAPNLKSCLRWKSRRRQKRVGVHRRGIQSPYRKMIGDRPKAATQRAEVGHWERDLLIGQISGPALLVLQDRKTRYTIIRKVQNRTTSEVNRITVEALRGQKVLTSTNDNGFEFGDYESLEESLRAPIYFCHPYTSSERGTVENTNGLIRQYFPKGYDFSSVTDREIKGVEEAINKRPKKVLGYRSPKEVHENKKIKMVLAESTYRRNASKRECDAMIADLKAGTGIDLTKYI